MSNPKRTLALQSHQIWNLERIDQADFLSRIKRQIPIVNLPKRKSPFVYGDYDSFTRSYAASTWGLLLPDYSDDNRTGRYVSFALISLFVSPVPPVTFHVSRLGISVEQTEISLNEKSQFHGHDRHFRRGAFFTFYRTLFRTVSDTQWSGFAAKAWTAREWRLSMAMMLYMDLLHYQKYKLAFLWPKECAEIVTVYETLLSRSRHDTADASMIQRIEVVLGGHFQTALGGLRAGLKELFDYRNEFLHGDLFRRLKKETKVPKGADFAVLPDLDMDFLDRQETILRSMFCCLFYLESKTAKRFSGQDSYVQNLIANGVMDEASRRRIRTLSARILALLPRDST